MKTEQSIEQQLCNSLYHEIRHLCSLCKCPSFVSQEQLEMIVKILKGEHSE